MIMEMKRHHDVNKDGDGDDDIHDIITIDR